GIAGLIKTALALYHRHIPGNLHFVRPNPTIDFDQLRLRVPVHCEDWPTSDGPATAGVNSFGYGGTNAHVVLQEAPHVGGRDQGSGVRDREMRNGYLAADPSPLTPDPCLVPLSARSPQALRALAGAWKQFLDGCPKEVSLHDL